MEEYSLAGLKAQIEDGANKTFYCFSADIIAAQKEIEEADIPIWAGIGNTPESITSIHVSQKSKQDKTEISIKSVPTNAFELLNFCQEFTGTTKQTLEYFGESQAVVFFRAFSALFTSRRIHMSTNTRDAIVARQKHRCALCQDPLRPRCFDIDHIKPLCRGGSNEPENLRALCIRCHDCVTQELLLSGVSTSIFTVHSHTSPKLWRDLVNAPKPKEIRYGYRDPTILPRAVTTFKDGVQIRTAPSAKRAKTQHVLDLLTGHPQPEVQIKPQIQAGTKTVRCLDAIKC
jgi:hypothetical protein